MDYHVLIVLVIAVIPETFTIISNSGLQCGPCGAEIYLVDQIRKELSTVEVMVNSLSADMIVIIEDYLNDDRKVDL